MSVDDRARGAGRPRRRWTTWVAGVVSLVVVGVLGGFAGAALLQSDDRDRGAAAPATTVPPATTAVAATTTLPPPAVTTTIPAAPTTASAAASTTSQPTAPAAPGRGGTVVVAGGAFAATAGLGDGTPMLNPFLDGFVPGEAWVMGRLVWAGATAVDPHTGGVLPDLVTEVPSPDNGLVVADGEGARVVFPIREEAVWEDGTPITAVDFMFTHEVITGSAAAINPEWTALHAFVASVDEGADPKEVVVTLATPDFRYRYLFPVVLPRHQVASTDFAVDWNDTLWLSAGPFRLAGRTGDAAEAGGPDEWRFERNPNSWRRDPVTGDPLPYLDDVVFRFYDRDDRGVAGGLAALEDGDVDVHLAATDLEIREAGLGGRTDIGRAGGPALIWEHADFQFGPTRFDANPASLAEHLRLRRAVAHAIDRGAIAGVAVGDPVDSIIELYLPAGDTGVWSELYPWSPSEAIELVAALFADLGRDPDTDPPTLTYDTSFGATTTEIGDQVVEQLQAVGIAAKAVYGDFFFDAFPERRWDLGAWRWVGGRGELDLARVLDVYDPANEGDDGNFGGWSGESAAAYREVMAQARATLEDEARRGLWTQAERLLAEDVVLIPLVTRDGGGTVLYRNDRVAGLDPGPGRGGETWQVGSWYRVDR